MAAKVVLERKVRWVLALVVVIIVALPLLAIRNYVSSAGGSDVHTSSAATDERLVAIDGRTTLVQPEALESAMRDWLSSPKDKTFSFEFSEHSFVPATAIPTPISLRRANQVAQLAAAYPGLTVRILLPAHPAGGVTRPLDQKRATRLRNALIARGVDESRVTVGIDDQNLPTTQTARIAVLMTK